MLQVFAYQRQFLGRIVVGISSPIKNIEEINLIKDLYKRKNQLGDLLMFTLAINKGIDLIDLLNLKVKDVKDKLYLSIGKDKSVPLNDEILELIKEVTKGRKANDYLFLNSNRQKLHRVSVFYAFKNICSELGLGDKYSVSSWRKTFAYQYYKKYKDLSYLLWLFNQTNIKMALKFIDEDENMNLRFREGVGL